MQPPTPPRRFTLAGLILRSLRYYWRTGALVALGVAVATAVIAGSLIVGDSVTGSLRDRALSHLGRIRYALTAPAFFSDDLATGWPAEPLLLLLGSAQGEQEGAVAPNVAVVGIDEEFPGLFSRGLPRLEHRQAAISRSLASDLQLKIGDTILLTVSRASAVASDSLFALRTPASATRALRVEVAAIVPDEGVGGFALDQSASGRRNVFVSRQWLGTALGLEGRANALVIADEAVMPAPPIASAAQELRRRCRLDDYGLKLVPSRSGTYVSLQSAAVTLTDRQVEGAVGQLASGAVVVARRRPRGHLGGDGAAGREAGDLVDVPGVVVGEEEIVGIVGPGGSE